MKRCKKVTAWTDYPFKELGDIAYQPAPIRRVQVLSYDGNKYATVALRGTEVVTTVKGFYLYREAGRLGYVKPLNRRKLERMVRL